MTTNPSSSPSPSRSSRPSRSSPASARAPGWSDSQRLTFLRACSAAGLNDAQRYILMHHCGCPSQAEGRPSIKHARNTNTMFAAAMAIAEAQARQRGREIRPPREFASWREAALSSRMQLVNKARCIITEARERMPAWFDEGLERYIVEHTTAGDDGELVTVAPKSLDEVDGGQAHRVVEALRAFVGRKFAQGGYTPRTFDIPPGAARRASTPNTPHPTPDGPPPAA
jgi:hypothetical protein